MFPLPAIVMVRIGGLSQAPILAPVLHVMDVKEAVSTMHTTLSIVMLTSPVLLVSY